MSKAAAHRPADAGLTNGLSDPEDGPAPGSPSAVRAWFYLVWFCLQRQARARQMVWIALALFGFTATIVALNTAANRWGMWHWRWRWREQPAGILTVGPVHEVISTYRETLTGLECLPVTLPWSESAIGIQDAINAAFEAVLERSDFFVFTSWVVFSIFLSFLLPIWSLSFATEALGSERESRSLVWLLIRPLPRSSIYLAKFVALLPWSLGLNLGGFGILCLLAGRPGYKAFELFWPAVLWATLAFGSLFHLLSACFRRSAVVALVYSFFLETILGNMPGLMKRISISFYARCMMFDVAHDYGIQPVKPSVYLPVSAATAWWVLVILTITFLLAGMVVFARSEYQDLT